ncbi:TPA: hypothetical protein ACH3X1_016139 [Trebouxia sp. C0004]
MHSQTEYSMLRCSTPQANQRGGFDHAAGVAKKQVTTTAIATAAAASTDMDLTAATTSGAAAQPGTEDLTEINLTTARHVSS